MGQSTANSIRYWVSTVFTLVILVTGIVALVIGIHNWIVGTETWPAFIYAAVALCFTYTWMLLGALMSASVAMINPLLRKVD